MRMSFRSWKYVDRHRRSIHEKSTPSVCYETGCHRSCHGFARKDSSEKHLRNVHQKHSKSGNTRLFSRRQGKESDLTEHGLEGFSGRQLVDMLVAERQQCCNQQKELQAVKDELITRPALHRDRAQDQGLGPVQLRGVVRCVGRRRGRLPPVGPVQRPRRLRRRLQVLGPGQFPCDSGSSGDFHGLEFTCRHKASGRTYGVTLEATNEPDVAALECSRRGFLCPVFAYRGSIGTC